MMTRHKRLLRVTAGATLALMASIAPASADERTFSDEITRKVEKEQYRFELQHRTTPKPRTSRSDPWRSAGVSYYGPGLYGNNVGCQGEPRLSPGTVGVAHKTLPCGTRVTFRHNGKTATGRVIDRGPYHPGRSFDLTEALCRKLDYCQAGTLEYQVG